MCLCLSSRFISQNAQHRRDPLPSNRMLSILFATYIRTTQIRPSKPHLPPNHGNPSDANVRAKRVCP
jgi:hypothetical protein